MKYDPVQFRTMQYNALFITIQYTTAKLTVSILPEKCLVIVRIPGLLNPLSPKSSPPLTKVQKVRSQSKESLTLLQEKY